MYYPTLEQVRSLSAQGNFVPVYRELPADLETPVSVYLRLRGQGPSFLLESVEQGEQIGRYSFLGTQPTMTLTAHGDRVILGGGAGASLAEHQGDPLQVLADVLARRRSVSLPGLPRFTGGAVGYLGYDLVRFMERLPATAPHDLAAIPDAIFLFADQLVIFDHVRHRLLVMTNARLEGDLTSAYAEAVSRVDALVARIRNPLVPPAPAVTSDGNGWESNFTQAGYEAAVCRAKEYIAAGDIFQVVLSQRLRRRTRADSFTIYRALRMLNPSPYMYYLELPGDVRVVGSSPEMLVRLEENGRAELRPIAGTRKRGATPEEDAALAAELRSDPKERAEHVMLVDLGRNDLGRVCQYGSVSVPELMVTEHYSHVMHLVSRVQGQLRPGLTAFDLLRATFPAGTLSGAPKVRAMEIIEELEGTRRGPYGGAVGYFGYGGTMDTCITIRTIVMKGDACYLQAGAGIVADSDPAREYEETLNKARALAVAVEQAEKGLENA
ncbi:MAG: anthranilate synthase component I [Anaerolineae bacterium]|nr:anthranilate synthase component I [Anaerolineae bacterium]